MGCKYFEQNGWGFQWSNVYKTIIKYVPQKEIENQEIENKVCNLTRIFKARCMCELEEAKSHYCAEQ